jgi:lipopolysaccharide transport protein LptA
MACSRSNSRAFALALALAAVSALGLLGTANGAPAPCANPKIEIQADQPADIDLRTNNAVLRNVEITQCDMRVKAGEARISGGIDVENSRWEFSGNVRITAEGGILRSDKATVTFRDKLIARAIITGTPAEFEQARKDGTLARGRASTMDYETSSGSVSFRENVWLSVDCKEFTGPQFVYNIKTQSVGGKSVRNAGAPGDRFRITIQPGDAEGKEPCPAPADPKP